MPPRPTIVCAILCAILASSLTSATGLAQPGPAPAAVAGKKDEALAHFEKGLTLSDKAAWDAALAEFSRSIELFPTRAATKNAAVCLRKLGRNDEALDLYEGLLRDAGELPVDLKAEAQRAILELRAIVGTIEIEAAQPGASITVDGRRRGEHPLFAPLHVNAGSHVVRLYSEGREPFETSVEVAGGQTARVTARLVQLVQAGSLRVSEKSGKALSVVVDGNVVGTTPWEGPIATGDHTVMLRGEDRIGTTPAPVSIRAGQRADVALSAEDLDATMRVEPVPADASVAIDGLFVGRGAWEGRVRPGTHKVALVADGYQNAEQEVKVERGGHGLMATTLKRDPGSPRWRKPGRFMIEVGGAAALGPAFGGDLGRSCGGACSAGLAVGGYGMVHGGYELGSGFGFGLEAGYLFLEQATTGRSASLQAVGIKSADAGTVDDTLKLRGILAGAFAGFGVGEQVRLRLRLGAGALIGSLSDTRTGTFTASQGQRFDVGPLIVRPGAAWFYVDPEVRVGLRLGSHVELSAGVGALLLISTAPRTWDAAVPVNAGSDGYASFGPEALTGSVLVAVTPGLSARYDF